MKNEQNKTRKTKKEWYLMVLGTLAEIRQEIKFAKMIGSATPTGDFRNYTFEELEEICRSYQRTCERLRDEMAAGII